MIARLNWDPVDQEAVDCLGENQVLHGHRLHTLGLYGIPSDITHFSRIFKLSLPRLRNLTIHFSGSPDEGGEFPLPDSEAALLPVALQLPMDMPLRVLSLRNATLPWSSSLFTGLGELYLDFKDCNAVVEISGGETLGILEASSQLERLSLVWVGRTAVNNIPQFTHKRTIQLANLTFLRLENSPEVVGYILAHVGTPAITSLRIRSRILSQDVARSLNLVVPGDHLQKRLFSNPPVFEIASTGHAVPDFMSVFIGSFKALFDFDVNDAGIISNAIMACIQPLAPPSATALKLDYTGLGLGEVGWREFVISHPEVHSIECSNSTGEPVYGSLWDALSPSGTDLVPPCPKLESIKLFGDPGSTRLLDCLLDRKNAGFELKYLKATSAAYGLAGEFNHLVGALEINKPVDSSALELKRKVRLIR